MGFAVAIVPPPFTPVSLPNCVLWLRADLGISIATGVSQWLDQSGCGNHVTQASGPNQPSLLSSWSNGKPAVRSTASQWLASAAFTAPAFGTTATILVAGQCNGAGAQVFVDLHAQAGTNLQLLCNGS